MAHTACHRLSFSVLVLGQGLDKTHTHICTHVACPIPVEIVVAKLQQQPAASRVPSIKVCVQFEYSQQVQPQKERERKRVRERGGDAAAHLGFCLASSQMSTN